MRRFAELRSRLGYLEEELYERLWWEAAGQIAEECGCSVEDLIEELDDFLGQRLETQRAELEELAEGLSPEELERLKALLW